MSSMRDALRKAEQARKARENARQKATLPKPPPQAQPEAEQKQKNCDPSFEFEIELVDREYATGKEDAYVAAAVREGR